MQELFDIYNRFLGFFPSSLHGVVSIILAILIVIGVVKVIQKQFVWIIVLIILLPASVPILKNLWQSVINIINFLLNRS